MPINPMDYSSKDVVLDVLRTEATNFFNVVDDPQNWHVQTRCTEWEVRDMVGHMIDVTEEYLKLWKVARKGESIEARGLLPMAELLNESAQSFRSQSRDDTIARLKDDYREMMATFEALTPEEWGGFNVPHLYMGPLPTLFYPAFQIIDYGIHTWDMRWGLGDKNGKMDERTAGLLIPYMLIVMQSTVDQESAKGLDTVIGIKIDGEWGGQWRATIKDGTFAYEPADTLNDVQAIFHYKHPSDFVLTTFQRIEAWEASGDQQVIERIRTLFFKI